MLIIAGSLVLLGVLLLAALSRHKKSATGPLELCGAHALVHEALAPEGAVIVGGELWRARARDGHFIPRQARVRVTGAGGHLLEVVACEGEKGHN